MFAVFWVVVWVVDCVWLFLCEVGLCCVFFVVSGLRVCL